MQTRIKHILVVLCFTVLIGGGLFINLIKADNEHSFSERRNLRQMPVFSDYGLMDGDYFTDLEAYVLDQFAFRDAFRRINAYTRRRLFRQTDINDLYLIGDGIYKMDFPLNERSIDNAAWLFNKIHADYLHGMDVYYSVAPDKNYFVADDHGYLHKDYARLLTLLEAGLDDFDYIDIFDALSIDDYYRTDLHWAQEGLTGVASILLEAMHREVIEATPYEYRSLGDFYGGYHGQAATAVHPDSMVYLTNHIIENATVYDYQTGEYGPIYDYEGFNGMDGYDFFLSGVRPLITIENDAAKSDAELIIFRDSFSSSLAPLLLEGYSKITLIDLRYVTHESLDTYITFDDQDVLFLYSTTILNNSWMLN